MSVGTQLLYLVRMYVRGSEALWYTHIESKIHRDLNENSKLVRAVHINRIGKGHLKHRVWSAELGVIRPSHTR